MNSILWQDSDSDFEVFELFDPAATGKVVGRISLSCSVEVRSTQLILPLSS
jgi:phosphatidylserine decarboxylase